MLSVFVEIYKVQKTNINQQSDNAEIILWNWDGQVRDKWIVLELEFLFVRKLKERLVVFLLKWKSFN